MKKTQTIIPLLQLFIVILSLNVSAQTEPFSKRTVFSGLNDAWEVVYGPHDSLWVTENSNYIVSRISLGATPQRTQLIDLRMGSGTGEKTFTGAPNPQGGLMGLAIHPNLYSNDPAVRAAKPWVYLAFVYSRTTNDCPDPGPACYFNTKIVRYTYNGNTLSSPVVIVNNMPGSSDHNSGRLLIGPTIENAGAGAHTQYRLYYTIGDMGAGQLTNGSRTNFAQSDDVMEGKVLRINTESDGDAGQDAWVPNDNPQYNSAAITPRDYVYSKGHRNPQGLAWGNVGGNWRLYSTEQSDRRDDEVNVITRGGNFGWDMISGDCDGDVNGFKIGGRNITDEEGSCAGTTEPIFKTFHNNTTYTSYPGNGTGNANWPTIASSSVAFYGANIIPNWRNSLLITPLKQNRVYRLKLNASGTAITGDTISYFRNDGSRIRRITVDPTGLKFYVARDAGTIMEYTYTGVTLPLRLLSFNGELINNSTLLQWETADESNTASFEIERSGDGVSFGKIGEVNASGNSNTSLKYSYADHEIGSQAVNTIYYRLKMVDIDGQFRYSNVISISIARIAGRMSLTPNPAEVSTTLSINSANNGLAEWKVIDNSGRIIMRGNMPLKVGINTTTIGLQKLTAGMYYLNVTGNAGDRKIKFQKL